MDTKLIKKYMDERANWIAQGKPMRKKEKIAELYIICEGCEHFKQSRPGRGRCGVCGCGLKKEGTILNKLAWSTTKCPLEEPKWTEEDGYVQLEATEEPTVEPPKKKGCGCGK